MKGFKKILPILIIVLVAVLIYSFFHIDGREIKNINKLSADCNVSVSVIDRSQEGRASREYQPNAEQIESLKNLLKKNSYTRRLNSTIYGVLPDQEYIIMADWTNDDRPQSLLYIKIIGNEYINFAGQYKLPFDRSEYFHKIQNPDFENELVEILGIE